MRFAPSNSIRCATTNQLLQEVNRQIDFAGRHLKAWRQSEHVLVITSYVEHQAHPRAAPIEISLHAFSENLARQFPIGLIAVRLTNLNSQGHPYSVRVAYYLRIAFLQGADLFQKV